VARPELRERGRAEEQKSEKDGPAARRHVLTLWTRRRCRDQELRDVQVRRSVRPAREDRELRPPAGRRGQADGVDDIDPVAAGLEHVSEEHGVELGTELAGRHVFEVRHENAVVDAGGVRRVVSVRLDSYDSRYSPGAERRRGRAPRTPDVENGAGSARNLLREVR